MSEGFISENDFLWYGVRTFAQNYLKKAQKNENIIELIQ